jgi:CubicO group peptidase (beta-lactamase class C family)
MAKYFIPVFLIFLHSLLPAQPADTLLRVDEIFAPWNNATPGMAVAIERHGKVIYHKAFGLANLEWPAPNTTATVFEAGSVSKQFTAAAVLLLAKEGRLSLSDPVRRYVPELPEYDAPITIQHLLNHTSGLKDWGVIYGLAGWPRTTRVYTQELSFDIVFRQRSLNFTPGTQYSYSNSNYVLLVLIAERVSGQSLAEFTHARFFQPLGLHHTRWRDNFRTIIPNRAQAYRKTGGHYEQEMPFENVHGPGGLLTTTTDLLRWNRLLDTHEILGPDMAAERIRPGKLSTGADITYAAGLTVAEVNGFREISHSGATGGYRAWLAWYPEKKLSVAMLSNDGSFNPAGTGRRIAELFLGKPEEKRQTEPQRFISLAANEAARWEGYYRTADRDEVIRIENNRGALALKGEAVRAVHSDTLYLARHTWLIRSVGGLQLVRPGGAETVTPTTAPVTTPAALAACQGVFSSEDAGATFKIQLKDGGLMVYRKPGDTFALEPLFKDGFRSPDRAVYEFTRDARGRVTGFLVSQQRAKNIPFRRVAEAGK